MTLFQMETRQGQLVQINLGQKNLDETLLTWLEEHQIQHWDDLEMWECGTVEVDLENKVITFFGDNGMLTMSEVDVQTV
tara:strand:- start:466 stop:702 length:237 start_codon:yes stop_codon:yes gene_type:complete